MGAGDFSPRSIRSLHLTLLLPLLMQTHYLPIIRYREALKASSADFLYFEDITGSIFIILPF